MGFSSLAGAGISGISSLLGASQVSDAASKAAQAQVIAGQNAQNALTGGLQSSTNALMPYTGLGSQAAGQLSNQLTNLSTPSDSPYTRYVDPSQYRTSGTANNISGTADNLSGTANNISAAGTYMDPNAYGVSAEGYGTDASQYATSAAPYQTSTSMSEADLENTPGYQFTLAQGKKGVQNAAAARGLGVSGAALKGAATYATGLSDSTYNTRFGQEQSANAQNFSQDLSANQANYQNDLTANAQNYGLTASAAGQNFSQQASAKSQDFNQLQGAATTNFGQQATAASTNFGQAATAASTNYGQQQGANSTNYSNALTAAGQNFGQDQTGFTDGQQGKSQSYNMLTGATGLGEQATGQQVGANTSTAIGTANALTGVGSAQAAADNASGQAYGAAYQGVGNALTGAVGNYNGYQVASAISPNVANASTFGSAFKNLLTGGQDGSNFLNNVSGSINKTGATSANGSMNV